MATRWKLILPKPQSVVKVVHSALHLLILILLCVSIVHPQKPCRIPVPYLSEKDGVTNQSANPSLSGSKEEAEKKLLIIADNQEHMLTGRLSTEMGRLSDIFISSVAMRSPLAHVGGRLLFKETLRFGRESKADLVLHLGDAANISCRNELESVFNALDDETPGKMWFMAPGNHDGMLTGNFSGYQPPLDYYLTEDEVETFYEKAPRKGLSDNEDSWIGACLSPKNWKYEPDIARETSNANPNANVNSCTEFDTDMLKRGILMRGDAIRLYVKRLKDRGGFCSGPPSSEKIRVEGTWVTCDIEKINLTAFNYTATASICRLTPKSEKPTKWVGPFASYIVQKLEVGGTTIILLDTTNYYDPSLFNAAFKAGLTDAQKRRADELLKDSEDPSGRINRDKVIIAGHHPLDDFPSEEQRWIIERTSRYMSAHVHRSTQLITHKNNRKQTLELNIGSTLDPPQQAVIAKVSSPTSMSFQVFGSKTESLGFLKTCKANEGSWKLRSKFYKGYRRGTYVNRLLESLDAAAAKRAEAFGPSVQPLVIPKGDQPGDWQFLYNALQDINAATGKSREFWACQTYYASEVLGMEESLLEWVKGKLKLGTKSGCDATKGALPFSPP